MKFIYNKKIIMRGNRHGFSLIELVVVLAVVLVMAAMAIPSIMNAVYMFRLRNAASEFSGLVQLSRSRAVRDSRYYAVYINGTANPTPNSVTLAFANIYPQNTDGTSGSTGGATIDPKDPSVSWTPDVKPHLKTDGAPNPGALQTLFLQNTSGYTLLDGYAASTPITFSAMGIPCVVSASVCNNYSGAGAFSTAQVAYWVFLKSDSNQSWTAVTVTPAGKIQKWSYSGSWTLL